MLVRKRYAQIRAEENGGKEVKEELPRSKVDPQKDDSHPLSSSFTSRTTSKGSLTSSSKRAPPPPSGSVVDDPLTSMHREPQDTTVAADDPLSQATALMQQRPDNGDSNKKGAFSSDPIKFWDRVGIRLGDGVDMKHSWAREQAGALDWSVQKAHVLNTYTTGAKVEVDESLLGDESNEVLENEDSSIEKTRQRLDALTTEQQRRQAARNRQFVDISQSEYIEHIHKVHANLKSNWESGKKVDALKCAVQCSKLLCHARAPAFYPSIFALVTAVLDSFGQFVFARIRKAADDQYKKMGNGTKLPEDFSPNDIGSTAREMCKNWLYKTACIRELLPRLYIEMALLPCYRFLSEADYAVLTLRLAQSCRGLGDPLVAVYARWYLARNVYKLVRDQPRRERTCILTVLQDYLRSFELCVSSERLKILESKGINLQKYLWLHRPALKWLFHQLARTRCDQKDFDDILELYYEFVCPAMRNHLALGNRDFAEGSSDDSPESVGGALVILDCLFDAFPGQFYPKDPTKLFSLVESASKLACPKTSRRFQGTDPYEKLVDLVHPAHVFRSITKGLIVSPPKNKGKMRKYLNNSWKIVSNLGGDSSSLQLFASCAEIYTAFVLRWMDSSISAVLLSDIVKHIERAQQQNPDRDLPDALLDSLQNILTQHLYHTSQKLQEGVDEEERKGLIDILTSENFVFLLDSFPPRRKQSVSENLLAAFVSTSVRISDNVLLQTMLDVARNVAQGIDSMASQDTRRRVDTILSSFIRKPYFSRDLEKHLNLLVDARAAFSYASSDNVNSTLVAEALKLCVQALNFVKFRHKDETRNFVKTVLAYCHVTVPSLADPFRRIKYFAHSGEIALANNCLGQADGLFRAAVQEIPPVASALNGEPVNSAQALLILYDNSKMENEFLLSMDFLCSRLLTMPGHPSHGGVYLLRSLLNGCRRIPWSPERGGFCHVLLNLLQLLFVFAQNYLPQEHKPKVSDFQWNSELFANDPAYSRELTELLESVINTFMSSVDSLKENINVNPSSESITAYTRYIFRFGQLMVQNVLASAATDEVNAVETPFVVLNTSQHGESGVRVQNVASWLGDHINSEQVKTQSVSKQVDGWKHKLLSKSGGSPSKSSGYSTSQAWKAFKKSERQWVKWIFSEQNA
eukprot:gb/GECG01006192.1/.p1 GENE.gb/GECG01006192.1/~~gb/GECG01006192.1/.p1  ORF type:complete len:1148 (+),score=150.73 gb/GECG01006192.1/:1-3444(+)